MTQKSSKQTTNPSQVIKQITSQKECPKTILIIGKDEIRRSRAVHLLLETFLGADKAHAKTGQHAGNLGLTKYDCRDFDTSGLKRLRDEIFALSLFAPKRFFLLQYVDELKVDPQRALLEIAQKAPQESKLFFEAAALAASSVFRKSPLFSETLVELPDLVDDELRRWVAKEMKSAGLTEFSAEALELIINVGEQSADSIYKLIDHLALYVDGSKVTEHDILSVFAAKIAPGEFDFIDTVGQKQWLKAEVLLNQLMRNGKNPFGLLALLSRAFSSYFTIKSMLLAGANSAQIRERLGVPPWVVNKQINAARNFSMTQLKTVLELILRADSQMKNYSLTTEGIFDGVISAACAR